MAETKNRVRFWRGTAESYELLKKAGALNYWTRYSVKYENGGLVTWKEFYGDNPLTEETGQLLPVIDIVQTLPKVLNPGDRYWVSDGGINLITTIGVGKDENGVATLSSRSLELKEGVSVRVKSKGYKSYLILDGELITYDEIDCGTYDNSAV
jgi:hypothetical protein